MSGKRFYSIEDVRLMCSRHIGRNRMTQKSFCYLLDVKESNFSRFMNGGSSIPSPIMDYFGLDEVKFYERKKK